MNNITTNNTAEARWNKAREQRDKLLDHYNKVIKPTLLEFYELTCEDFNIYTKGNKEDNKPYIRFYRGLTISYFEDHNDRAPILSIQLVDHVGIINTSKLYDHDRLDIIMVRLLVKYWDKIKEYMDTRIAIINDDSK